MEVQEGIKYLINKYSSFDWYDSVAIDKYGRYVVYVNIKDGKTNAEIMKTVDYDLNGKQILVHYASSKPENMKKYNIIYDLYRPKFISPPILVEEEIEELSINIDELIMELDRLELICGYHGLQSIFYELHDGKNAITNLGSMYPEVKQDMSKLYDQYGFDVLYNELDS
jgi:hypothetical protein